MDRIPMHDESPDPNDGEADYLEDRDYDGHYDELDFEDEEDFYDVDDDLYDPLEDEQDYGRGDDL